ncbi:hypothetical protein MLD38_003161 [Melastoma candidum]|uniref:Uncharacterized protein n=1 Tax=Melastoma candidum TaxID=119954 RepID=A0ACB9S2E1_9MYRT|nr:hypothetical protein MLD38_003161 [Melastoma candidum]
MELSLNLGFPGFSSLDHDSVDRTRDVTGRSIGGGVDADGGDCGYLRRLEDEMRKIEPFRRELPLCMILLENTIKRLRMRTCLREDEEEEETTETVTPSINELFPLKRKPEDEESGEVSRNGKKRASCDNDSGLFKSDLNRGDGCDKPACMDCPSNSAGENCSGFLQLQNKTESSQKSSVKRDTGCSLSLMSPTSVLVNPAMAKAKSSGGSSLVFGSSFVAEQMKLQGKTHPQQPHQIMQNQLNQGMLKKQRRSWSPELHRHFLEALQKLGGAQVATPKQIREMMKVQGLTNDEVKSHLQKYRLNIRRVASPSNDPNASKAISGNWSTRGEGEEDEEEEEECRENSDGHSWVTGHREKQLLAS